MTKHHTEFMTKPDFEFMTKRKEQFRGHACMMQNKKRPRASVSGHGLCTVQQTWAWHGHNSVGLQVLKLISCKTVQAFPRQLRQLWLMTAHVWGIDVACGMTQCGQA